ncbi:MAG: hypothetical protein HEQ40_12165 [Lacibacter sp.]|jgi:hypothetical protein
MEYHQPDDRWELFALKDFEAYNKSLVVKGQFHPKVHKDVADSFVLCEYMMAHAYYHYPLYDEALSKLLLILEMGVKLRCKELEIPLQYEIYNKKKGITEERKKKLHQLIEDLDTKEPQKKIKDALHRYRSLRNMFMHPEQYQYSGIGGKKAIVFGICILNMLFLNEALFVSIENEVKRLEEFHAQFNNDLYVMAYADQRILVEDIGIMGAVPIENIWRYLLVVSPVLELADVDDFSYPVPIILEIDSVSFNNGKLEVKESDSERIISFEVTDHPTNLAKYQNFLARKEALPEDESWAYKLAIKSDISLKKDEFWYKWLWKIDTC